MRNVQWTMVVLFAAAGWVIAADEAKSAHAKMDKSSKAKAETGLVQKTCPVSGKPIREDQFTEYEGRKVYFCCGGCPAKFKESPMKYLPALYRQIYPQRVQVKCPVMGGPVDHKVFLDEKGQRVYFCCPDCIAKFKQDPAKYMAKLKDVSTQQVHCPVSGEAINPKVSVEDHGQMVYFCCKDCMAKFKADPSKYAAALRPEAGVLAYGATAEDDIIQCPTCLAKGGGQHKRKEAKTADYEGKTYFLCRDACVTEFKADPGKYVKALDEEMKKLGATEQAKPKAAEAK